MLRTLAVLVALTPTAALAAPIPLMPGDDFCAAFNGAAAGDEIVLAPGDYTGPCALTSGGEPGAPKVLRSADPAQPANIVYAGNSANVFDVLTSHVVLQGLHLGPSQPDIDAIKIKDGGDIRIEGCTLEMIGGISIAANSKDSDRVEIVGNRFLDLQATGIYLGCQDGMSACSARDVRIEGNLIDAVDSANVGYGLEIKLDSFGVVRDNVIHDTKGPGVEIYGSTDPARRTIVEGNLIVGSRNNATLEIAGGPTLVQNNIVVGGAYAGLYVYDYMNRDLVRDIQVIGNTIVGDEGPAVLLAEWAEGKQLELSDNAVWQAMGAGPPLPAPIAGVAMLANHVCVDPASCWQDGAARDFWPIDGSPLLAGATPQIAATPAIDFCGQPRGAVPQIGALERGLSPGPGPLPIALKRELPCPAGEEETTGDETTGDTTASTGEPETDTGSASSGSGETGTTDPVPPTTGEPGSESGAGTTGATTDTSGDTHDSVGDLSPPGCGCDAPAGPPGALLGLLLLLRRRRGA